jgi:hypothetical protein
MAQLNRGAVLRAEEQRQRFEQFKVRLSRGSEKDKEALEYIKELENTLKNETQKHNALKNALQNLKEIFRKLKIVD